MAKFLIKNTFLELDEDEATDAPSSPGSRRPSSCPPLASRHATSGAPAGDEASSESSWRTPAPPSGAGLDLGAERSGPTAVARSPLCRASLGAPASDEDSSEGSRRTPLSSKAVAFVPGVSPAAGKPAPAPAPGLPQVPAGLPKDATLMMRNLPCGLVREDLRHLLDSKGFAGCYDFLYVPMDFNTECSVGYAFINLKSKQQALRFTDVFDGFKDWPIKSSKVCALTVPQTQGLDANINRFQNSPVMGREVPGHFKPMLFVGKHQVPFPEPTQKLPKLMIRKQRRRDVSQRHPWLI